MEIKTTTKKHIIKQLLKQELPESSEEDLIEMLIDKPISVDVDKEDRETLTRGDKIADKVAEIVGSWPFILGFSGFLLFWVILNGVLLVTKAFDPYPFILLNLLLSCISALQAPIIMMSQNRQAAKDSLRNQNDYRTDLKSELILEELHDKMETILDNQKKILKEIEASKNEKN